jgi:hypothetical protein
MVDGRPPSYSTDDDGDGYTEAQGDCDDANPNVQPAAQEICFNGVDDNCNGATDGAEPDKDGDGFGPCGGDCDDSDPKVNPLAKEIPDGKDNNCDGKIDADVDGDGYSVADGDCDDDDPAVRPGAKEICNDGIDNDKDGDKDCSDTECSQDPACTGTGGTYENNTAMPIPDNDSAGATSTITVNDPGTIAALAVSVDITHSYRGDLEVKVVHPDGTERVLFQPAADSTQDLKETFPVSEFNGKDGQGAWKLQVRDTAQFDSGTLNGWKLEISR